VVFRATSTWPNATEGVPYRASSNSEGKGRTVEWFATIRELISSLVDPDKLAQLVIAYQHAIYFLLFAIVFCETGLVVTPFLPGDSMLFAAGAVAAMGQLNPLWLFAALAAAAILGDTVNYWIGAYIGPRAFTDHYRFLQKKHLDRTHRFFDRYGGLTVILARFVPFVRTFAPFVAGIGAMNYARFIVYNIVGGVAWVAMFVYGGYFFGNMEVVKKNFSLVIAAIIVISVLPIAVEILRARFAGGLADEPTNEN
jgi:membrane-associated protein